MAGHIQDRWYRTEPGRDGKPVKVKIDRQGVGMRYRAWYIGPDGTEKSKSFADKQKRRAETWLANIEADMSRGDYIAPEAGKGHLRAVRHQVDDDSDDGPCHPRVCRDAVTPARNPSHR